MAAPLEAWSPIVALLLALIVSAHVVFNKREVRSAAAWVGVVLLVPGIGALLYLLLGINRIQRKADRVRAGMRRYEGASASQLTVARLEAQLAPTDPHLAGIARTIGKTGRWSLLTGNAVRVLRDGDEAYPEMLAAIGAARRSIALGTYIFDDDPTGRRFVEALAAARSRGVEVRVLIDDAGARYSFPSIDGALRRRGVRVARFLRVLAPWSAAFANLRNHRKILAVDGRVGFTGGMNIRHGCTRGERGQPNIRDLHFRVDGPIVTDLVAVFGEDWTFTTGETLVGDAWFPSLEDAGTTVARVVSDGPDDDFDCLRWALLGALGSARRSVRILTPYFLPDEPLVTALNAAALRGVTVDIVLPARGNLRLVDWAMRGELWKVLRHGCRVWLTPPPFDHSKAMVVDDGWALVGSSNWDPRSLRLNFELGVECYDRALATELGGVIEERIAAATRLDGATLEAAPWPIRLRNATVRLFSPYL